MQPFTIHTGRVAVLDRANVDTDQIIPKQFLKRVERTGFGQFLFYDWRFLPTGAPNAEFELNNSRYAGASILIAGKNFGCGSSREHAPWALADYGFRAIIAPSFADIFANNSRKNGLLPVILAEAEIRHLINQATDSEVCQLTINLENKTVTDTRGFIAKFEIGDFERSCLLQGLDDIGLTLQHSADIEAYERDVRAFPPYPRFRSGLLPAARTLILRRSATTSPAGCSPASKRNWATENANRCALILVCSAEAGTTMRNPLIAGILSLLIPGLGQIYNGRVLIGIIWMLIFGISWIGTVGWFGLIVHVISAWCAYSFARDHPVRA